MCSRKGIIESMYVCMYVYPEANRSSSNMSILCLLSLYVLWQAEASASRRMLHEPLFPNSPASSPKPTQKGFFFPPYHYGHNSPPTPTPTPTPTPFPANISSLLFPQPSSSPHSLPHHAVAIVVSLSLLSSALLLLLLLALLYFRTHHPSPDPPDLPSSASDTLPLYPPNTFPSAPLSLGSSPELKPLPPLPPHPNTAQLHHLHHDYDEDQFFSPRLSPVRAALRFHTPSPPFSQQRNNSDNISLPTKKPPSPPPLPPPKPKLKPLHWDQLRPSSDLTMVLDHLKPASFQLNEGMTETLFMVNHTSDFPFRDHARRHIVASPTLDLEYRVLDPKKSHNIAILLRALNVTVDEVCVALEEGNWDMLGTELLESLLKMAPNKDEERKLKDFKDEPAFKLGHAEKFLKIMLDIPFAFKRVDAMLYISNFDSESEYLKKSFATLEVACEELRNNRLFLKLLEAVLRTGNRMNVGTNRGNAHAFKLDALLKLVDIKGADGKSTLLHFVVQEMVRIEGTRISGTTNNHRISENNLQSTLQDEVEVRKLGLQVVSGLSGELCNVKKAATMDSDMLSSDVSKLARGIAKVGEVYKLNRESPWRETSQKFSETMDGFLKKGEEEIALIQAQEKNAFSSVKELMEYFHGNSSKEEAHPLRIFIVVRDFLSILDRVCKEVSKVNERTLVGFRQYSKPSNPIMLQIFHEIVGSLDDENSSHPS